MSTGELRRRRRQRMATIQEETAWASLLFLGKNLFQNEI